jgi:hypothetical protein
MTRGDKKFIIGLSLVLTLWRVVEMPAVQHAFLQFLAVGEVPGLKQPLSPKAVYMVVATLFSLSLILIFRKELIRSVRRYRPVGQPSASPNLKPEPSVIVIRRLRGAVSLTIPIPKLRLGDKKLPALYVPSIPSVMPIIWRLMDLEMRMIAAAYRSIRVASRFTWRHTRAAGIKLWSWLEPRFRSLDKRIEKRVRRNDVLSEILEIVEECWRMLRLRFRKTRPTD